MQVSHNAFSLHAVPLCPLEDEEHVKVLQSPIPATIPVLSREKPAGQYLWEGFSAGPRSSAAGRAGGCGTDTPCNPCVGPRERVWGEQEEGRMEGAAKHRNISCRRALTS